MGRSGRNPRVRGDSSNVYGSAGTCRGIVAMGCGKHGDKREGFFDHLDFLRNRLSMNGTVHRKGQIRFR